MSALAHLDTLYADGCGGKKKAPKVDTNDAKAARERIKLLEAEKAAAIKAAEEWRNKYTEEVASKQRMFASNKEEIERLRGRLGDEVVREAQLQSDKDALQATLAGEVKKNLVATVKDASADQALRNELAAAKALADERAVQLKANKNQLELKEQELAIEREQQRQLKLQNDEMTARLQVASETTEALLQGEVVMQKLAEWEAEAKAKGAGVQMPSETKMQLDKMNDLLNSEAFFKTKHQNAGAMFADFASAMFEYAKVFGAARVKSDIKSQQAAFNEASKDVFPRIKKATDKIGKFFPGPAGPQLAGFMGQISEKYSGLLKAYLKIVKRDGGGPLPLKDFETFVLKGVVSNVSIAAAKKAFVEKHSKQSEEWKKVLEQIVDAVDAMYALADVILTAAVGANLKKDDVDIEEFAIQFRLSLRQFILYGLSHVSRDEKNMNTANKKRDPAISAFRQLGSDIYDALIEDRRLGEKGKSFVKKLNPFKDELGNGIAPVAASISLASLSTRAIQRQSSLLVKPTMEMVAEMAAAAPKKKSNLRVIDI